MAEVQLVIVEGPNAGRDFDLAGGLIVGRGEEAGIVIDDGEASRRHASLSSEGDVVTVEDMGSTNGTFLNEERIGGPRRAVAGDRIRIGTTVFEVRALTQATRLGTAIPEEPIDVQATAVGRTIPDEEPIETQATAIGHSVPDETPPGAPGGPPLSGAPGGMPPGGAPGAMPPAGAPGGPPPAGAPGGPPPAGGPGGPAWLSEPPGGEPPPPAEPPTGAPPPSGPPAAGPPPAAFPPPTGAPAPSQPPSGFPPPPGPPGGFAAPGRPPAPYGGGSGAGFGAYPIHYEADYPQAGIDRWRPFLHGIMAFPHFFVLFFVSIAAFFAFVGAWFSILFTRTYPRGIFDFLVGVQRWSARTTGFTYLFTQRYPPFSTADDPTYPVRLWVDYPANGIARWRPLLQGLMVIPHLFVLFFIGFAGGFALLFAAIAIIFTRRYPPGLFNFIVGWQRWTQRVNGYALLMTEEYPPFSLE